MNTLADLAAKGLVFQAVLDVEGLPDWIAAPIQAAGIDLGRYRRLVMLGQGGPGLWESIRADGFDSDDPFDAYCKALVEGFVLALGAPDAEVVYPSDALLPLGRMAQHVGWGSPSPLGLTINHWYGPWLAHRIVFLIDAALPITDRASGPHPCTTCVATPCVTACPVGAVSVDAGFDVERCSAFRLQDDSPCADRCLARLACPIGTGFIYGDEQMAHHYRSGLASIRRWSSSREPGST